MMNLTQKLMVVMVVLLVLLGVLPTRQVYADHKINWSGQILLNSGELHKADSFKTSPSGILFHLPGEKRLSSVKWTEITKFELIKRHIDEGAFSKSALSSGSVVRLTLRNGNSQDIVTASGVSGVSIIYVDAFTGKKTESSFSWEDIRAMSFDSNIGTMKYDDIHKIYFPASYNFNPETGRKLIWRTPPGTKEGKK